jgi:alpha-1,6-mannosyltransferase
LLWLAAVYALALILIDRGLGARRGALWVVVGGAAVFQVTLLFLPGLFSQDVFSYIAYGRIAAVYELNPYIWPPSVLRDPVVPWVAEVWRSYAAPYGPAWVDVQWLVAKLSDRLSIADQALFYRGIANVLLLVNLGLAWRLLRRLVPQRQAQRTAALAALAWNPLVLFEIAGNAHNDALMVSFVFLGLLLFRDSSRGILASAALALGTLVKYLCGLGFIWLALASAARAKSWTRRSLRVVGLGVTAFVLAVVLALPWLELPDSLSPLLNETAGVGYVNSLPDIYALMLVARLGVPVDFARGIERPIVLLCFAVYLAWETRRVWREPNRVGVGRAVARSSLVYVLLVAASVQTWYLCLPVSVAAALGWRSRLTRLTLAYSALALPALYLSYYLRDNTPGWVFLVYGLAPLLLFVPGLAGPWQRRDQPNPVTMARGRIPSL